MMCAGRPSRPNAFIDLSCPSLPLLLPPALLAPGPTPRACPTAPAAAPPTPRARPAARAPPPAQQRQQAPPAQREASDPGAEDLRPHLLLQLRCLDADSGSEEAALGYDAWCRCTFQMFQTYVTSFSYGCCKSGSGCCICCNGCTRMLQVSVPNVSSIFSDVCCKCVYMDVTYLSHICCKRFICMLRIFAIVFKCF
jgi:hypothetical protein